MHTYTHAYEHAHTRTCIHTYEEIMNDMTMVVHVICVLQLYLDLLWRVQATSHRGRQEKKEN